MTDYVDVPEVNRLYQEREIVAQAIAIIDSGGYLATMTLAPSNPMPTPAPTIPTAPPLILSGVTVSIPPPTPANVLADVRAWLIERQDDLDDQLKKLGVKDPPVRKT